MNELLAYILMYISAAFYCGFDAAIKEKAVEFSNDTTVQSVFHPLSYPFNHQCEVTGCLGKSLKLYNEKAEIIEDGWLAGVGAFSGFNSTEINNVKKALDICIPQVNQQLGFYTSNKCSRYEIGYKLIIQCVDTKIKRN